MRLARVGEAGRERPVVVGADGSLLDLRPLTADLDGAFLHHGLASVGPAVAAGALLPLTADEATGIRFGVPVTRPGKVVGIGLNYQCYAEAVGVPVPTEPVVFLKASSALCGPTDPIRLIPGSTTTDYEVELAVVIGQELRDASIAEALAAVAGYSLADDLSDRDLQLERGGTWTKGKSADTYCPLGPWFVTPDELGDPQAVALTLDVNGIRRQTGTTARMVFPVGELLAYVSGLMTLEPGDVVITGTPAGVAVAAPEPRPYLRDGDVIEIDGGVLGRHVSLVHARSGAGTRATGRPAPRVPKTLI